MQEHYERLLEKAKDELEELRKQVDESQKKLLFTQKWYVSCRGCAVYQGRGFSKDHLLVDCPLCTTDLFLRSCEERENEAEELRQQLQSRTSELKKAKEVCLLYEEDEQKLKEETRDIQRKLDEEKRRSASCDLQVQGWDAH